MPPFRRAAIAATSLLLGVFFIAAIHAALSPNTAVIAEAPLAARETEERQERNAPPPHTTTSQEDAFIISIHPTLPPYTVHVASFTPEAAGTIAIFRGDETDAPLQVIALDPALRLSDRVPAFFRSNDINFDGFTDIGVMRDGGATWASYEYWTFDKDSGRFVSTPLTDAFKDIGFSHIAFNAKKKKIITNNFIGPLVGAKTVYEVNGNTISVREEHVQEQEYDSAGRPVEKCTVTVKKYENEKNDVTVEILPRMCPGYYNAL